MADKFLIVNKTNFSQSWASSFLGTIMHKDMRVVILPLGYDEGWASDKNEWHDQFHTSGDVAYDVERPFRAYGVHHFNWLDFHRENPFSVAQKIRNSDVCVLIGTDPEAAMERIEDLELRKTLQMYRGLLVTLSEVSHILETEFESGEEADRRQKEGLGLIPSMRFHMHYSETEEELRTLIRYLETDSKPVIVLPEKAGFYLSEGTVELLGDAFIAEDNDLDELYSLVQ